MSHFLCFEELFPKLAKDLLIHKRRKLLIVLNNYCKTQQKNI